MESIEQETQILLLFFEGKLSLYYKEIEYALLCFNRVIQKAPGTELAEMAEDILIEWEE